MEERIPIKLRQCYGVYDSDDVREHRKSVETLLFDILDYFSKKENTITEEMYEETVNMFAIRSFPASNPEVPNPDSLYNDVIYEVFLCLLDLKNFDESVARNYIDRTFVSELMDLFDSGIEEKRVFLAKILLRIYLKRLVDPTIILTEIRNIFNTFMRTQRHRGIAEWLEFLRSILKTFPVPFRNGTKNFFLNDLLLLYTARTASSYCSVLTNCVLELLAIDSTLTILVVRSLLNLWPNTSSSKEVLFLGEFHKILKVMKPNEFEQFFMPIGRRLARSLLSHNPRVRECAVDIFLSYFHKLPNLSAIVNDIDNDDLSALYALYVKPENENDESSLTESAVLDITNESDDSLLVFNASDIASIVTKQLETMNTSSSSKDDGSKKGLLNNDISTVSNMKVRIAEEENIVHIIPSDHDDKVL